MRFLVSQIFRIAPTTTTALHRSAPGIVTARTLTSRVAASMVSVIDVITTRLTWLSTACRDETSGLVSDL